MTTRADIINHIQTKIDEYTPEGEGIQFSVEEVVTDPIQEYIDNLLDESVKEVYLSVPPSFITPVASNATPVKNADGSGYVILPTDFLFLSMFQIAGWSRPVTRAITTTDPKYKLQSNPYLRGGTSKPVCVLSARGNQKVLEYYSLDPSVTTHTIQTFLYVNSPVAESSEPLLLTAIEWQCASKVLQIMNRTDASNSASGRVKDEINLLIQK